jgi:hypothetical protein
LELNQLEGQLPPFPASLTGLYVELIDCRHIDAVANFTCVEFRKLSYNRFNGTLPQPMPPALKTL